MGIISGKILQLNGWPEGPIIRIAKDAADALWRAGLDRDQALERLTAVRVTPTAYLDDSDLGALAQAWIGLQARDDDDEPVALRESPLPYRVWGREFIDVGALAQMDNAMRLPVAAAGALMPDAHVGYGLPIGGVLATEGAVIPYAVGVDIACRMRLSLYDVSPIVLEQRPKDYAQAILTQTRFGAGEVFKGKDRREHAVLDDPDWSATGLLRRLRDTAVGQLGTSGGGNHFVEWGKFELREDDDALGLKAGTYLALLSHSGSRGVGYQIADAYSKLAMRLQPELDPAVKHLAWLDIDGQEGQEYWVGMNLAGRFASANHAVIHRAVAQAAGLQEIASVENHHNFAWREQLPDGRTVFVHRKGATPAGEGVLGVIPGSMADPGYVVRGRGLPASLNSASHGAGRQLSRKKAIATISKRERDAYLAERGVRLLGGGLDESPQAYKRIEDVIAAQSDLVSIVGKFTPRIVRMADDGKDW